MHSSVGTRLTWANGQACFAGGNFLLGGQYLDNPDYIDLGLKVTDSCHHTYNNTVTGLGPFCKHARPVAGYPSCSNFNTDCRLSLALAEVWAWYNQSNQAYDPSDNSNSSERAEAAKNGYFVADPGFGAFPETIESIFYAWRITGDLKWQDYNWEIFQALEKEVNSQGDPVPYVNDETNPSSLEDYVPRRASLITE